MTDEIAKMTTENMDQFFGKLNQAADIVSAKLVAASPEAADAILHTVQFKGIFELLSSFLVMVIFLKLGISTKNWLTKKGEDGNNQFYHLDSAAMLPVLGVVGCAIMSAVAFIDVLSFYNWLSAIYPEGAIALKALEVVGVHL